MWIKLGARRINLALKEDVIFNVDHAVIVGAHHEGACTIRDRQEIAALRMYVDCFAADVVGMYQKAKKSALDAAITERLEEPDEPVVELMEARRHG